MGWLIVVFVLGIILGAVLLGSWIVYELVKEWLW